MTGRAIAVGVVARTGRAVVVMLQGSRDVPGFVGRREIGLAGPGLPAQPFHAAAALDLAAAGMLIGQAERAAAETAADELRALVASLPALPSVSGVAVVVKAVAIPDSVEQVLRSHAWMHAAEGLLYREAVLAAALQCGWTAYAVDLSTLPAADQVLGALGRDAGRPWRRTEKDAARAALTLLH
jgi:hypothetical protein